jgi:hypothetical protein
MIRAIQVAALGVGLLMSGCATQPMLPPGQDPEELVATIVQRRQEPHPAEPESPPSTFTDNCIRTAMYTPGYALLVPLAILCLAYRGSPHN